MLTAAFRPLDVCSCVWLSRDFVLVAASSVHICLCVFSARQTLLDSSLKSEKSCPHSCCDSVVCLKDTQFDVWSFEIVIIITAEVGTFCFLSLKENHFVNFVNQINQPKSPFLSIYLRWHFNHVAHPFNKVLAASLPHFQVDPDKMFRNPQLCYIRRISLRKLQTGAVNAMMIRTRLS